MAEEVLDKKDNEKLIKEFEKFEKEITGYGLHKNITKLLMN
ncbi:MAG: hypothetical protein ABIK78_06955 [candidate division WOR-3 bacterium]